MSEFLKDDNFSNNESVSSKYKNEFLKIIDKYKKLYQEKISNILGNNYFVFTENYLKINKIIKDKRQNFLNSREYLLKKQELKNKKNYLDSLDTNSTNYDEAKVDFDKTLLELSTLNVKLNNSMKEELNLEKNCLENLKKLFDSKKEEVFLIKKMIENEALLYIKEMINKFNDEVENLKTVYGEKIDIDFFKTFSTDGIGILNKFEVDYFTAVSENNNSGVKVEIVNVDNVELFKSPNNDTQIN